VELAAEQCRVFVHSALGLLTDVAKNGWSDAFWDRDFAPEVKVTTTSGGLFLAETVSDATLLKAFETASEKCPRRPGAGG
jgi:hypothetical protein